MGWRHVQVTEQRTNKDFANQMRDLVDIHYPDAQRIRVVLDNLSCHSGAALYQSFCPEEARRILRRLEFHYTPRHGSWLNMAEIEISVLGRQCLGRRIDNQDALRATIRAAASTAPHTKHTGHIQKDLNVHRKRLARCARLPHC